MPKHETQARGRGNPQAFTPAESKQIRQVFRELAKRRGWTQAEAGKMVGIGQQAAQRLLDASNDKASPSRQTANRIAQLLALPDAEALLRSKGGSAMLVRSDREIAAEVAKNLGYEHAAISAVLEQHGEGEAKPVKWWLHRFYMEEIEQAAASRGLRLLPSKGRN